MFHKLAAWYFDVFYGEYSTYFKMWKAWSISGILNGKKYPNQFTHQFTLCYYFIG